jgi:hypothetical protein
MNSSFIHADPFGKISLMNQPYQNSNQVSR